MQAMYFRSVRLFVTYHQHVDHATDFSFKFNMGDYKHKLLSNSNVGYIGTKGTVLREDAHACLHEFRAQLA
jgi:hypothetical protein